MSNGELSVIVIGSIIFASYLVACFSSDPNKPSWLRHTTGILAVVQFLGVLYLMAVIRS